MKAILSSLFILILTFNALAQTCGTGGITLNSQADVNNFSTNYPGCTELVGALTISGPDITNLNGLSNITIIRGNLDIKDNPLLNGLIGLDNLTQVAQGSDSFGRVLIQNNPGLEDFTGLGSLTYVFNDFSVADCANVTSFQGLSSLDQVDNSVGIEGCPLLTDMTGLENLTKLGSISIGPNAGLTSLNGLTSLTFLGMISDQKGIGDYSVLSYVTSLPYGLSIQYNGEMKGLENVESIGGSVFFNSIGNLSGLPKLKTIAGTLYIYDTYLTNLVALQNVETIGGLEIFNNEYLSHCAIQSICRFLNTPPVTSFVSQNAYGCDNEIEVRSSLECQGYLEPSFVINFNGLKSGTDILLSWQTAAEQNVLEYAVERSLTVTNFTEIGTVPTQGNSAGIQNYSLTDPNSNLDNYYRLKQRNTDATFSYSNIIYVKGNVPPCPLGGVGFTTQAQLDSFAVLYPGCETIAGSVYISGPDITSLQGLSNIREINGTLRIMSSPLLASLSGLSALERINEDPNYELPVVTGEFWLNQLPLLTNLSGLENLQSVARSTIVSYCRALTDVSALRNLARVNFTGLAISDLSSMTGYTNLRSLAVSYNEQLTTLNGIPTNSLRAVEMRHNPILDDIGALSPVKKYFNLILDDNPLLTDLNALSSADTIQYLYLSDLAATSLSVFQNIDPSALSTLFITSSPALTGCNVPSFCIYLSNPSKQASIWGNGVGCSSRAEILATEECLTILPVDLVSFSGQNAPEGNKLIWRTASEITNKGFEVERSANGRVFSKIGFVEGKGNSNQERSYSFTDSSPSPTSYYRLKQLDFDGKSEYSKIIVLQIGDQITKVYPNPARGQLHIESANQNQPYSIKNIRGFSVMESSVLPNKPLDTSTLQSGLYLITIGKEVFKVSVQN